MYIELQQSLLAMDEMQLWALMCSKNSAPKHSLTVESV